MCSAKYAFHVSVIIIFLVYVLDIKIVDFVNTLFFILLYCTVD